MSDGTRLAARVWLPDDADADPVPAVLEAVPYRLNDGTVAGDHQQMTWFAGHGYAGVRVDIRGSGESDGILTDEYTEQEQADCVEVIAWLAAQPWCTGKVGMMGYSWSGFNALQVAALRPPALKAIASCFASDDRFADDVHYRGGLVEPMDMVHWSTCMHAWQARPPDPEVVGERWREMWLERLEQPPWIEHWLAHQRRDAYWENGSVRDAYDQIECAVMCVAGWTDGYNDAALRLMEGLDVPRRALIGPWGHNDPVHGNPGPAVGILSEFVRWWDRWLKGIDNGIDREPTVVAWMQDSVPPSANLEQRPGRWVAEQRWPSPLSQPLSLALGDGELGDPVSHELTRSIGSVQTVGLDGGAWCADGRSADLPVDQLVDDARSLTFTGSPLPAPLEILGFPVVTVGVSSDRPVALISVRLCELRADGSSLLVTRAQLNLCHRDSHARPALTGTRAGVPNHRQPRLDRASIRGRQPHPPLGLAVLLAAGVAVAGACDAQPASRRGQRAGAAHASAEGRGWPVAAARSTAGARAACHRAGRGQARRVSNRHPRPRQRPCRAVVRLGHGRVDADTQRAALSGHVSRLIQRGGGRSAVGRGAGREHLGGRP